MFLDLTDHLRAARALTHYRQVRHAQWLVPGLPCLTHANPTVPEALEKY